MTQHEKASVPETKDKEGLDQTPKASGLLGIRGGETWDVDADLAAMDVSPWKAAEVAAMYERTSRR